MLDLSTAREIASGDESFVKAILEMFVSKLPEHRSSIRDVLDGRDGEKLAQAAHKFKSACGVVGATDLHRQLQLLEKNARLPNPEWDDLVRQAGDVLGATETVEKWVRQAIAQMDHGE